MRWQRSWLAPTWKHGMPSAIDADLALPQPCKASQSECSKCRFRGGLKLTVAETFV